MNYSRVNNPKDYSPLLYYSQQTQYIFFTKFLNLLIHWRKPGNGHFLKPTDDIYTSILKENKKQAFE